MNAINKFFRFIFDRHVILSKIAFFINEEYILDHYTAVINNLDPKVVDIVLADKFNDVKYDKLISDLASQSWNIVFLSQVFHIKKYKVLVTNQFFGGDTESPGTFTQRILNIVQMAFTSAGIKFSKKLPKQYFQKSLGVYNIRFMYGADAGGVKFGAYNYVFDEFFCHGPKDSDIVTSLFNRPVYEMGYPRYDNYFDNVKDEQYKYHLLKKHFCDHEKPTILWIVTVSEYFSTIETYEHYMKQFTMKYNVIVRPHPLEIDPQYDRFNQKVHDIVYSGGFIVSDNAYQNMSDLYLIADYVFCDYGGTIFSALYLDKKILLMNHEKVSLDIPVYGSTSMEVREFLPSLNIDETKYFGEKFHNPAFWESNESAREKARLHYFGSNRENASEDTASRMMEILNHA